MKVTDQHINNSTNQLLDYTLQLADNSLIMGHRLSEWTGHGPILEQDIAISNIALDLIGQSRNFYQYAALLINQSANQPINLTTEDSLAYLRNADEFKNIILVELPNGDWATTMLKLFFFSSYQYLLYQNLINSADKQLSAIAEKSFKEVIYHVRWSSEWVIRLGDGTEESHNRMQTALNELWNYTAEMFVTTEYENDVVKNSIGVESISLKNDWYKKVNKVIIEATLLLPEKNSIVMEGKTGKHTNWLSLLLTDMQYLQRTFPGCEW